MTGQFSAKHQQLLARLGNRLQAAERAADEAEQAASAGRLTPAWWLLDREASAKRVEYDCLIAAVNRLVNLGA
jgi:hypothetical protein